MRRLFLLGDDLSLISGFPFVVKKQGHEIDVACTILEADTLWANGSYDLVILDVSLPDGSSLNFCRKTRRVSKVPVMFLVAVDEETDTIMGLDMRGDDYITKPFKLAVFLSGINVLPRRSENLNTAIAEISSNGIHIQLLRGMVYRNGKRLDLAAGEYKLLCSSTEYPDQILSPDRILGKLRDCSEQYIDDNSLTVYIRRLRIKIEDNLGAPERIVAAHDMRYKWNTAN